MIRIALFAALLMLPAASVDPIPVLLITGENNHDWKTTSPIHKEILEKTGKFKVDITTEPAKTLADAEGIKKYKVFYLDFNSNKRWGEVAEKNFLDAVKGGVGVSVIHAADNAFNGWVEYEKMVGHLWRKGTGHGPQHKFDVRFLDKEHPITKDMPEIKAHFDELYHNLMYMHGVEHKVLAVAFSDKEKYKGTGKDEPMIVVLQYGQGRIFHTPLGHCMGGKAEPVMDPQFQLLVARGTEWAATGACTIKEIK